MSRKNAIAAAEARSFRQNFAKHDVRYFHGHGRFVDEHTVSVTSSTGETRISGDFVLISTGSKPLRPADIDFADDWIHDSDEILTIHDLPNSLTILGGGVIGCEYACMFAALGVGVTLVDARSEILPFIDAEIVARLKAAMTKIGIRMVQGQRWTKVLRCEKGVTATLADGSTIENEQLLFAAGRSGCAVEPRLGERRAGTGCSRLHSGGQRISHQGAAHLRGRRRDRLSCPRLGVDGARPRRHVSRLRLRLQESRRSRDAIRHLHHPGSELVRRDRGDLQRKEDRLRGRPRAVRKQRARKNHGRSRRHHEARGGRPKPASSSACT